MPTADNKRIAKNTLFLYFRMFIVMGVQLYTSRVILKTLGVDDFGIYNIVGGVVILFSFLKSSLTTALQRYINYALGKDDVKYEEQVFSSGFYIMVILSGIILLLLETVGLWFVNHELSIPPDSIYATNVVYQLSILTFIVNILRTPFDSLILAHERMSFYAYLSIGEAVLKLLIVYLLVIISANKLILYGILVLLVTSLINVVIGIYAKRQFGLKISGNYNKSTAKELSTFSGWNIFGGIADIGYQQGTNIILNIFYGVTLNATMGITNQVKNAIFSFVRNILSAANPQIFQLHSAGKIYEFRQLVIRISKFAFYLYLIVALPLIFNIKYILSIWLENQPPMAAIFCILILIFCMVDSLIGPLWTAAQADGNIKRYQIISSSILLLNLPLTYIAFRVGLSPYYMLVVQIGVVILSLLYRVVYLSDKGLLPIGLYAKDVILPILMVTIMSMLFAIGINHILANDNLHRLLINTPLYLIATIIFIFFIGLTRQERGFAVNIFKRIIHKS